MGKLGKTVSKATYGIVGIAMKPIYEQMKKERKEEVRRWNKSLRIAVEDAEIDSRQPGRFEVHQPIESIVHIRSIW